MKNERDHASAHAYERSFVAYPQLWFERKIGLFILTLAFLIPTEYVFQSSGNLPNLEFSIFGMTLYLVGIAADVVSTHIAFSQKPKFDKRGLFFPVAESGAFLPLVPSLKYHVFSFNMLAALMITPLCYFYPSLGLALFASRMAAALANLRQHKRLSLTLQMTQDMVLG